MQVCSRKTALRSLHTRCMLTHTRPHVPFGSAAANVNEAELELSDGADTEEVRRELVRRFPDLQEIMPSCALARNAGVWPLMKLCPAPYEYRQFSARRDCCRALPSASCSLSSRALCMCARSVY